uniref:Uncharacterized protein n=1 Tax=viral metagenome TaxID=1070528 RepID=A0A6M3Y1W9_9ZZZZ
MDKTDEGPLLALRSIRDSFLLCHIDAFEAKRRLSTLGFRPRSARLVLHLWIEDEIAALHDIEWGGG